MNFSPRTICGLRRFALLISAFSLCLPLYSFSNVVQNFVNQGQSAENQGYFNLAAHYYYHAVKQDPNNTELLSDLARVLQKSGHLSLAEEYWQKVYDINIDDANAKSQLDLLRDPVSRKALEDKAQGSQILPAGPKVSNPIEKGNAAWVKGDARTIANEINEFNNGAPHLQRIKYIFPAGGTISFFGGRAGFHWKPANAYVLADTLVGEGRVYPVISGSSMGAELMSEKDWEALGTTVAAAVENDPRISGLLLEIRPEVPQLRNLLAVIKSHSSKPIGVALEIWGKEDFDYSDFTVLHCVQSVSAARDQISAFLDDARGESGKAIIGFPDSPETFDDRRVVLEKSVQDDDTAYLGIGVNYPADPSVMTKLKIPLELK